MKTKLHPNTPTSPSLRTTVPEGICEFLGLRKGDTIEWVMEVKDNQRFAVVRKSVEE